MSQLYTPLQRTDPDKDRQWADLDDDASFMVVSDEEEEEHMQVQEVQEVHRTKEEEPAPAPVPGHEDMLTGKVHCTNIELRTSKVLNSLIAQVISGHHGTNRHGPFRGRGDPGLSHASTQDSGVR